MQFPPPHPVNLSPPYAFVDGRPIKPLIVNIPYAFILVHPSLDYVPWTCNIHTEDFSFKVIGRTDHLTLKVHDKTRETIFFVVDELPIPFDCVIPNKFLV